MWLSAALRLLRLVGSRAGRLHVSPTCFMPLPQRKALGEQLEDLLDALLRTGVVRGRAQVIEARVPIIKCHMDLGGPEGLAVDVCIGAANGAAAVGFVRRQVRPWHRPVSRL